MNEQKFRKLDVWKKAMDFVEIVYKVTAKLPSIETYGLISQLRRASISIVLNIAEGSGAGSDKEFNRFLSMSLKSSYEVMCGTEIIKRLNYCNGKEAEEILVLCEEISAMISGLKKKLMAES